MASRSLSLVWSPTAQRDMADIWGYLDLHASREVADSQIRKINARALTLISNPRIGRPRDNFMPGLRQVLVNPYIVFYRFDETTIEIMRVAHGRRDLPALFMEET